MNPELVGASLILVAGLSLNNKIAQRFRIQSGIYFDPYSFPELDKIIKVGNVNAFYHAVAGEQEDFRRRFYRPLMQKILQTWEKSSVRNTAQKESAIEHKQRLDNGDDAYDVMRDFLMENPGAFGPEITPDTRQETLAPLKKLLIKGINDFPALIGAYDVNGRRKIANEAIERAGWAFCKEGFIFTFLPLILTRWVDMTIFTPPGGDIMGGFLRSVMFIAGIVASDLTKPVAGTPELRELVDVLLFTTLSLAVLALVGRSSEEIIYSAEALPLGYLLGIIRDNVLPDQVRVGFLVEVCALCVGLYGQKNRDELTIPVLMLVVAGGAIDAWRIWKSAKRSLGDNFILRLMYEILEHPEYEERRVAEPVSVLTTVRSQRKSLRLYLMGMLMFVGLDQLRHGLQKPFTPTPKCKYLGIRKFARLVVEPGYFNTADTAIRYLEEWERQKKLTLQIYNKRPSDIVKEMWTDTYCKTLIQEITSPDYHLYRWPLMIGLLSNESAEMVKAIQSINDNKSRSLDLLKDMELEIENVNAAMKARETDLGGPGINFLKGCLYASFFLTAMVNIDEIALVNFESLRFLRLGILQLPSPGSEPLALPIPDLIKRFNENERCTNKTLEESAGEFRGFLELLIHVDNNTNFIADSFGGMTKPDLNKYQVGGVPINCKPNWTLEEDNFIKTKLEIIQLYLDRHFTYTYPSVSGNPFLMIGAYSGLLYRPLLDGPDVVVFQNMRRINIENKTPKSFKDQIYSVLETARPIATSLATSWYPDWSLSMAVTEYQLLGSVSILTLANLWRQYRPDVQVQLWVLRWVETLLVNASRGADLLWRAMFDMLLYLVSVLVGEAVGDPLLPRSGVSSGEADLDARRKKGKLELQMTESKKWTLGFWILQVACEHYGFFRIYKSPDTLSYFIQFLGFPIVNYFCATMSLSKLSEYGEFMKKNKRATESFNEQSSTPPRRSSSTTTDDSEEKRIREAVARDMPLKPL